MEFFLQKKRINGAQLILIKYLDQFLHPLLIMFRMSFNSLTKTLPLKLIIF